MELAPVGASGDGFALTPCLVWTDGPDRGAPLGATAGRWRDRSGRLSAGTNGPERLAEIQDHHDQRENSYHTCHYRNRDLLATPAGFRSRYSGTARTRSPAEIISEDEGSTASLGRISPAPIDGVAGSRGGSECSADDSTDSPNCDANPSLGRTRKPSVVNRGAGRGAASGAIEESSNWEDTESDSRGISGAKFERVFSVFLRGEIA